MVIHSGATRGPTVRGADQVELATWDLGGDGPGLLLSHATGFHGRIWAPLAAVLTPRYHLFAIDHRGHGSSGHAPNGRYDDWEVFTDDLLAVVDALAAASLIERSNLFGAGHSLGGAILMLAAQRRPGLFRALYCYEPIMVPPQPPGEPARPNELTGLTRRRRETFPTLEAARANYASKPPFASFVPEALDAYVEGAFVPRADGTMGLSCRAAEESSVYEGAYRHHAYEQLGQMDVPVTVACGEFGGDLGLDLLGDIAARLPHGRLEPTAGCGHFGPMEAPDRVANAIVATLEAGAGGATSTRTVTPPR
jgi:pimeloyl-ACP methyl ester carboxylesterase